MTRPAAIASLLALLVACGDDGGPEDAGTDADRGDAGADAATDAGADAGTDAGRDAATDAGRDAATDAGRDAATDAGRDAAPSDGGPPPSCEGGATHFYVVDILQLGEESPPASGSAPGFDLDGRVSDDTDELGCFIPDFTSPDGERGIDNQIAALLPTLEGATGTDVNAELAASIRNGALLMLLELTGVDDFTSDDCVVVRLLGGLLPAGTVRPMLDAGGRFVPGQTFDVDAASVDPGTMESLVQAAAAITAGELRTERFDFPLPFPIDATLYDLPVHDALLTADAAADRLSNGLLGGGIAVEDLVDLVLTLSPTLPEMLIRATLMSTADLEPDGAGSCRSISVGAVFGAVRAMRGVVR